MSNKNIKNKKRICGTCPACILDKKSSCFWQIENEMPEHFKPSIIKAFISINNVNGHGYLQANELNSSFDPEFISWFVTFCVGKQINAFWKINDKPFILGSVDFIESLWKILKEEGKNA